MSYEKKGHKQKWEEVVQTGFCCCCLGVDDASVRLELREAEVDGVTRREPRGGFRGPMCQMFP